jgi:hypothetical protein
MRNIKLVFSFLVLAAIGVLTACVMPVEDSTEIAAELSAPDTSDLEALETLAEPDENSTEDVDCYNTNCTPGSQGDRYCTSLCGDTARCFSSGYGCGTNPCCILM